MPFPTPAEIPAGWQDGTSSLPHSEEQREPAAQGEWPSLGAEEWGSQPGGGEPRNLALSLLRTCKEAGNNRPAYNFSHGPVTSGGCRQSNPVSST